MERTIQAWAGHLLRRHLLALCIPLLACSGCAAWQPAGLGDFSHTGFIQPEYARIRFVTRTGHAFPTPLLYVTVAGQATTMILDTGSPFNVLGATIAERLGLMVLAKRGRGADAAGRRIHYKRIKSPRIRIENWGRPLKTPAVVTRLPTIFDTLGIAGLLSPWQLTQHGQALVINFPDQRLSVMSHAMATTTLDIHAGNRIPLVASPRKGAGMSYTMRVHIDGVPVKLLVDTGSTSISVYADSAIGQKLERMPGSIRKSVTLVSGQAGYHQAYEGTLQIGETKENAQLLLMRGRKNNHAGYDGIVGMSYLKTCILLLTPERGIALCQ